MKKLSLTLVAACLCVAVTAGAAELGRWTPDAKESGQKTKGMGAVSFQLAIWPPVQIFSEAYDVYGLQLSLPYARNTDLYGLALGVFNHDTGDVKAVQLGGGNRGGNVAGAQLGLVNLADTSMVGFQLGLFDSVGGYGSGMQLGGINLGSESYSGLQLGVFNMAADMFGVQLGLVNVAKTMTGVQVGLMNFIWQSPYVSFAPIFNFCF